MEPLLSIIVPVYNTEDYLRECLDSLLKQSLDHYEILIINDGSTDNSQAIIDEYVNQYPFIQAFTQENRGLSAVRNRGIKLSRGRYLYFIDSDDWLQENTFPTLMALIHERNLDVVFFGARNYFENLSSEEMTTADKMQLDYFKYDRAFGYYNHGEELMADLIESNQYYTSACLSIVRKDFFVENDLWFIEGYLHEDVLYTAKLYLTAGPCYHTDQPIYQRHLRQESITTSSDNAAERFMGLAKMYTEMQNLFEGWDFVNKKTKKAFSTRLAYLFDNCMDVYQEMSAIDQEKYADLLTAIYQKGKAYRFYTPYYFVKYRFSNLFRFYQRLRK